MDNLQQLLKTQNLILPSSLSITIRETTALEEGILTRTKSADGNLDRGKNLSAFNKFIASIINNPPISEVDVFNWKISDKYYTLLQSRILSLGSELVFPHKCSNDKCGHEESFTEDLTKFLLNSDDPEYTDLKCKEYPNKQDKDRTITLASNKIIRYEYITGAGEVMTLDTPEEELDITDEFIVRNLCIKTGEDVFKPLAKPDMVQLTSRDSAEIRKDIRENDIQFMALSKLTCPKCTNVDFFPIVLVPDFFFPAGI